MKSDKDRFLAMAAELEAEGNVEKAEIFFSWAQECEALEQNRKPSPTGCYICGWDGSPGDKWECPGCGTV